MNLNLDNLGSEPTVFAMMGSAAVFLFLSYYCMMRKYQVNKVKAQVEQNEYFIEKVREDDTISNASTTF